MQLFSANATILKKKKNLPTKCWKKHPQKVLRNINFFHPKLPKQLKQNNSRSKMWLMNYIYYRPTLYKTGPLARKYIRPDKSTLRRLHLHILERYVQL